MNGRSRLIGLVLAMASISPALGARERGSGQAVQPPRDAYVIALQDVVSITVWDHPEVTGKFTVQPDGSVTLPLLGRIQAAGQTVVEFETALTRALADGGLIVEPRVFATLDQFRGRRVFIFGAVAAPGTYVLIENESLIQALARAGYASASEAVIVRPKKPTAGPTLPDAAADGDVIRVNLRDFEKDVEHGSLERNVMLREGDTIFVPRSDPTRVFVSGQVRAPGAYSIAEGTTVLQALTLAGGPTEQAAMNRIRLLRLVKGKQVSIKPRLSDIIQPGDTLVVPERFL